MRIAKVQQSSGQVVMGLGERNPQGERMPVRRQGPIVFAQVHQRVAELQTGGGVSRVECQSLLEAESPPRGPFRARRGACPERTSDPGSAARPGSHGAGRRSAPPFCLFDEEAPRAAPADPGDWIARQGAGENRLPNGRSAAARAGAKPFRFCCNWFQFARPPSIDHRKPRDHSTLMMSQAQWNAVSATPAEFEVNRPWLDEQAIGLGMARPGPSSARRDTYSP